MSADHRDEDDEVTAAACRADAAWEDGAAASEEEGPLDADEDGDEADASTTTGGPPAISRKVRRRRRRTRPRSKTIAMKRLTREELRVGAMMYPPVDVPRPSTREQCRQDVRPCPWVACKHHLYLDINPETGSIKINFPDLEPWELQNTCALDVAERGGITLEEVGEIMNLTRERIRQVEVRGLLKLKMGSPSPDELGADLLKIEGN
jgi:Sigma-70, region 4